MDAHDRTSGAAGARGRLRTGIALAAGLTVGAVALGATPAGAAVTVPSAPVGATARPTRNAAVVTWAPPTRNGGAAIRRYTVTASPGGRTCTTTGARSCTVGGLTNRVTYRFTVRATNVRGTGAASTPTAPVVVGVPTAPRSASVVSLVASARVAWLPPVSTGGAAIVRTTVTASPGGRTCTTTGTTCTVFGLTNGTAYRFAVASSNAFGTGPGLAAPTASTIIGTPSAPRNLQFSCAGPGTPQVTGLAPLSAGASPILRYEGKGTANFLGLVFTRDWTSVGLSLAYQVPNVPAGVRIVAEVRAVNSFGPGVTTPITFTSTC